MDNAPNVTRNRAWNVEKPPLIPHREDVFTTGMPQADARDIPDLNLEPEDWRTTGERRNFAKKPSNPSNPQREPSNPQPGPSNFQSGPSNPQQGPSNPQQGPSYPQQGPNDSQEEPPVESFYPGQIPNPKPFFTGKMAESLEGMRKVLVRMRQRFKHKKKPSEGKRSPSNKSGQTNFSDSRKRGRHSSSDSDGDSG